MIETSQAVKESYLENLHLFLSHEPLDNYVLKIEAKSKAAQRAMAVTPGNPIEKSLKSTLYLILLEILMAVDGSGTVLLKYTQKLFNFLEEMAIDKGFIDLLVKDFLYPVISNRRAVDITTFESAVMTFETLVGHQSSALQPQVIDACIGSLIHNLSLEITKENKSLLRLEEEERNIGLLLSSLPLIFPHHPELLMVHANNLVLVFESLFALEIADDRKYMVIHLWFNVCCQARQLRNSMQIGRSFNLPEQSRSGLSLETKPFQDDSSVRNFCSAVNEDKTSTRILKFLTEFSEKLFALISGSFISKSVRNENFENCYIDSINNLTSFECGFFINHLEASLQKGPSTIVHKLLGVPKKDKNILKLTEKFLISKGLSLPTKELLYEKFFRLIGESSINNEKACSLSRVIDLNRNELSLLSEEQQKSILALTMKCFISDKKKIVSNAIRMVGILLSSLSLDQIEAVTQAIPKVEGKASFDFLMVQLTKFLASDFQKYSRNATYAFSWIISKFEIIMQISGQQSLKPIEKKLVDYAKKAIPLIVNNFIGNTSVKLKVHSLQLIKSDSVLPLVEPEQILSIENFIVQLNTGSWTQMASPEFADIKHLQDLKNASIEMMLKLLAYFDKNNIEDSEFYAPILSCFDFIVLKLREAILETGTTLEDIDEVTGKLINKPSLYLPLTKEIKNIIDSLKVAKRKLQKFDDLCLSLSRFDKMNKILESEVQGDLMKIENVFVEVRVTNE